ncbi:MAG: hypothetical protein ABID04_00620 [Patescibacteria group bacterium]
MNPVGKNTIDTHVRTYRSVLRSSKEITLSTLVPTYLKMEPSSHPGANSPQPDLPTLVYAQSRLPEQTLESQLIIIGQTEEVFEEANYQIKTWQKVSAEKRRRHSFWNPKSKTLALMAASISDVDDIINLLIALQIEANKQENKAIDLKVQLLENNWVNFAKTAQGWWKTITSKTKSILDLTNQPLVFVSSNNHSLINLIDGFCLKNQKTILDQIKSDFPEVQKEIDDRQIKNKDYKTYFASQFVFAKNKKLWQKKLAQEEKLGIVRIPPQQDLPLETQIIPGKLISPGLKDLNVLNIEYPLGFTAFHILEEILENVKQVKGVYILGKAAALNTTPGDILIPKIVFDEHTQNTYLIENCFNNNFPYRFESGSILDNQKLVSVLGTLLENRALFEEYSGQEFNIVEMEAGPYLGAVTQATYPKSLPQDTIVDLHQPPFDLGLIYYSSDNPYTLSKTLGEFLGMTGIEATYLGTKAIIKRFSKTNFD